MGLSRMQMYLIFPKLRGMTDFHRFSKLPSLTQEGPLLWPQPTAPVLFLFSSQWAASLAFISAFRPLSYCSWWSCLLECSPFTSPFEVLTILQSPYQELFWTPKKTIFPPKEMLVRLPPYHFALIFFLADESIKPTVRVNYVFVFPFV